MGYSPCGCKESDTTEQLTHSVNVLTQLGLAFSKASFSGHEWGPVCDLHCESPERKDVWHQVLLGHSGH